VIAVQTAWEAAGGNPGIQASRDDLVVALHDLDRVCDEAEQLHAFLREQGLSAAFSQYAAKAAAAEREQAAQASGSTPSPGM
jgi:hypothetical protein